MITITARDLQEGPYQDTCPGCAKLLAEMGHFRARSRYAHGDLCSERGTREAFEGDFFGRRINERFAHTKKQGK